MIHATPKALIAATPTLSRKGLITVLREWWPQLRITLTADATQLPELVTHLPFGLLILDEALVGRALPTLLARLYHARPTQRLVVLTELQSPAQSADALPAPGSPLYLSRHILPHALAAALAVWLNAPAPVGGARRQGSHAISDPFSPRELEVLRLVVADCCNEEIANRLFINVRTVETHRRNLLHKAGTRTLVGLAVQAVREGWVA